MLCQILRGLVIAAVAVVILIQNQPYTCSIAVSFSNSCVRYNSQKIFTLGLVFDCHENVLILELFLSGSNEYACQWYTVYLTCGSLGIIVE